MHKRAVGLLASFPLYVNSLLYSDKWEVREMDLTRFGEAETVDSFREVVHAHILGFGAILEKLLQKQF